MRPVDGFTRRVLFNTSATVTTAAWSVVLGVVSTSVLLTRLGIADFGLYALIQSFSILTGWASISTNGMAVTTTRRLSSIDDAALGSTGKVDLRSLHKTNGRGPWETPMSIIMMTGIAVAALLALLGPLIPRAVSGLTSADEQAATLAIRWFALQTMAEACFVGMGSVFEGFQRLDISRSLDALRRTATIGTGVVVSLFVPELEAVAAAQAITGIALAMILLAVTGLRPRSLLPISEVRPFLVETLGPSAINASGVLHRMMDRAIVALMLGPAAVAVIEVATRLVDVVRLVLASTSQAMMSAAPWLKARGADEKLAWVVRIATRLTVGLTLIAGATIAALRESVLTAWTDASMAAAVAPLFLVGFVFVTIESPLQVTNNMMLGLGRFRKLTYTVWAGVVVNLIASVLLVDRLGEMGTFVGTLIGSIVILAVLVPELVKMAASTPAELSRTVLAPALPAGAAAYVAGSAVVLFGFGPWLTIVVGLAAAGVAACGTAWLTLITGDERERLVELVAARRSAAVAKDDRAQRSNEDLHVERQ